MENEEKRIQDIGRFRAVAQPENKMWPFKLYHRNPFGGLDYVGEFSTMDAVREYIVQWRRVS